jgi:hypothetical protein
MNEVLDDRVYYFTVATKPDKGLNMLIDTCRYHNINLDVLGMNDQRLQQWGDNLWVKLDYLNQVLKSLQSDTIVLFTDAYDVLCTRDLSYAVEHFKNTKHPILFSAEYYCFPKEYKSQYTDTQQQMPFPYLNSGTFIGYVWALRELFKRMPDYKAPGNDQKYCQMAYLAYPDLIQLDHDNKVFVCAANTLSDHFTFAKGQGMYQDKPITFIHVNGSKDMLVPLYQRWKMSTPHGTRAYRRRTYCITLMMILLILIVSGTVIFMRRKKNKIS